MPCDQIITTHVEFLEKSTDIPTLKKAMKNLGFRVQETSLGISFQRGYREFGSYNKKTGSLTLPETVDGNQVKVEYSKETVNEQAKQFGWDVEWGTDDEGNPAAEVTKRGW